MKRSDIDQTSGDERDVEHVLQALTTASGVESDGEVQVLEVNQDTGIIRFITNNMVVRTLATALNFSGDLVRAIYRVHLNKGTQSTTGNFWSRGMVSFCSNFIPPIYQKLQESISRSKIPIESIKLESDIYQNHSIFMKKHWQ